MFCSAYNDYISSFEELLVRDDTVNIHQCNRRALATEMYKISHNRSPSFIRELFTEKNVDYKTRSNVTRDVDNDDKVHCARSKLKNS